MCLTPQGRRRLSLEGEGERRARAGIQFKRAVQTMLSPVCLITILIGASKMVLSSLGQLLQLVQLGQRL
jgi:hypothetical protein